MRALALLVLLTTPALAAPPTFSADLADVPLAKRAYGVLLKSCPRIPRAVEASSSVKIVPDGGAVSNRIKYDWAAQLLVQLTLRDGRGLLPNGLANTAAFREAWFVMGGPSRPGIIPLTPAARVLCGLPGSRDGNDEDTLIDVPDLGFLAAWPSERRRPAAKPPRPGCPDPNTAYRLGETPPTPPGC